MPAKNKKAPPARGKSQSKSKQPKQPSPVRRELWGFLCLLLAVFAFIGLIGLKGVVLNLFALGSKYLIGWGTYLLPVSLLVCALLLFFHGRRPVKGRITIALLLPLLLAILLQLLLVDERTVWALKMLTEFGDSGLALKSGGMFGGFLAAVLGWALSRFFAALLIIVALAVCVLVLLRVSAHSVVEFLRRDREPREPKQPPEPAYTQQAGPRRFDLPAVAPPPAKKPKKQAPLVDTLAPDLFGQAKTPTAPRPVAVVADELPDDETLPTETAHNFGAKPALGAYTMFDSNAPVERLPTGGDSLDTSLPSVLSTVEREATPPEQPTSAPADEPLPKTPPTQLMHIPSPEDGSPTSPYRYPPMTLLKSQRATGGQEGQREMEQMATRLMDTLTSFRIDCRIVNVTRGPTVTRYELELATGVKLSSLSNLSHDIALALGANGVRIAPVPGKASVVGVEVPNKLVNVVYLRDVLDAHEFTKHSSQVAFAIGKDISGASVVGDIAKMPHLLIAGTTGSGKSVCMNSLIISLLYKSSPEELRLIMVDPKMVEFDVYNGIPHLLVPVVTDPKKAAGALQWAVVEMEKRYRMFRERSVRNIDDYNREVSGDEEAPHMPRIVVLIDELADLMVVARKEVEESIIRLAQKARAAGIYLVIATQRPSADVITGLMKANLPSRIAFAVASQLESRIILDTMGAEALIGRGDMLYLPLGAPKPMRVQGCFVTTDEVEEIVRYVKANCAADYNEQTISEMEQMAEKRGSNGSGGGDLSDDADDDPILYDALRVAVENGRLSTTMLQTRLKLGYARAARVVDQLEERGFIGPLNGAKPREILISREQYEELMARRSL